MQPQTGYPYHRSNSNGRFVGIEGFKVCVHELQEIATGSQVCLEADLTENDRRCHRGKYLSQAQQVWTSKGLGQTQVETDKRGIQAVAAAVNRNWANASRGIGKLLERRPV